MCFSVQTELRFVVKALFTFFSGGTGGNWPCILERGSPCSKFGFIHEINQKGHRVQRRRKGKIIVFTRKPAGTSKGVEMMSKAKKQSKTSGKALWSHKKCLDDSERSLKQQKVPLKGGSEHHLMGRGSPGISLSSSFQLETSRISEQFRRWVLIIKSL